jgi:putative tryptophan/tyrosine transport system substrate-binding protein
VNRRAFVTGLGAVLAAPLAAKAEQARKIAKVGVLALRVTEGREFQALWGSFVAGLRGYGWIENQNVVFERRYSDGPEGYSRPAAELVALQPDVIVSALGEPAILALRRATTRIPIVMLVSADPRILSTWPAARRKRSARLAP